jgi:hypothetical protein
MFLPVQRNLQPKSDRVVEVMDSVEPLKAISMLRIYNEVAHSNNKWFAVDNPYRDLHPICEMTGWTGGRGAATETVRRQSAR